MHTWLSAACYLTHTVGQSRPLQLHSLTLRKSNTKGHFSTLFHHQTPFVHLRCSWQLLDLPRALRPPFQVPSVELVMGASFSTDAVPGLGYIPLSTYFGVTHPTGVFFYTGTSLRLSLGLTTWAMLLFFFFFLHAK